MTRFQLTTFLSGPVAEAIEAVRMAVDPVQHRLIPAHVTLCREDELASFEGWRQRLESLTGEFLPFSLRFGQAEPFAGHGLMLPCIEGVERFRNVRRAILGSDRVRESHPHVTLAHPRNPKAAGNTIEVTRDLPDSFEIEFRAVSLIEQIGDHPWRVLETFPSNPSAAIDGLG